MLNYIIQHTGRVAASFEDWPVLIQTAFLANAQMFHIVVRDIGVQQGIKKHQLKKQARTQDCFKGATSPRGSREIYIGFRCKIGLAERVYDDS